MVTINGEEVAKEFNDVKDELVIDSPERTTVRVYAKSSNDDTYLHMVFRSLVDCEIPVSKLSSSKAFTVHGHQFLCEDFASSEPQAVEAVAEKPVDVRAQHCETGVDSATYKLRDTHPCGEFEAKYPDGPTSGGGKLPFGVWSSRYWCEDLVLYQQHEAEKAAYTAAEQAE